MNLLFRIVYAAHANGTHHKLALDALTKMSHPRADDWQRVFLKHAELYLEGAKAPDKEFKDFRNHVLHPGDSYWGGAPEKARGWYTHLIDALKEENWSEAVWCAGVLSHYYTDPIQPFHTGQSDAESAIHRAAEWSISRSYNELLALGATRTADLTLTLPEGDRWIEEFVCAGADTAHPHYERLIAHYDINIGVSDPPAGLDSVARELIGELLVYAATGFARILDRAIDEAGVTPPKVDLSVDTALATLKIPVKWVLRKIDDAQERAAVQAIYDELMETGRVEESLSQDDRTIRDLHEKEILKPRRAKREAERRRRVSNQSGPPQRGALSTLTPRNDDNTEAPRITPQHANMATTISRAEPVAPAEEQSKAANDDARTPPPLASISPASDDQPDSRTPRVYLSGPDPLESAPAIGPKTAKRLGAVGLLNINDLLEANPEEVASALKTRHITAATISNWQDLARLVMQVPGLRGTHAQLLAGAGYRDAKTIADAEPAALSADILKYAATPSGRRILRDGMPPDIEKIKAWVENAAQSIAA